MKIILECVHVQDFVFMPDTIKSHCGDLILNEKNVMVCLDTNNKPVNMSEPLNKNTHNKKIIHTFLVRADFLYFIMVCVFSVVLFRCDVKHRIDLI